MTLRRMALTALLPRSIAHMAPVLEAGEKVLNDNPASIIEGEVEDLLKLYSIGRFVNYGKNRAVLSYFLFRKVTEGSSPNLFL